MLSDSGRSPPVVVEELEAAARRTARDLLVAGAGWVATERRSPMTRLPQSPASESPARLLDGGQVSRLASSLRPCIRQQQPEQRPHSQLQHPEQRPRAGISRLS
jgi:hypothetical protein